MCLIKKLGKMLLGGKEPCFLKNMEDAILYAHGWEESHHQHGHGHHHRGWWNFYRNYLMNTQTETQNNNNNNNTNTKEENTCDDSLCNHEEDKAEELPSVIPAAVFEELMPTIEESIQREVEVAADEMLDICIAAAQNICDDSIELEGFTAEENSAPTLTQMIAQQQSQPIICDLSF